MFWADKQKSSEVIEKVSLVLETYIFPIALLCLTVQSIFILIALRWPQLVSAYYSYGQGTAGINDIIVVLNFLKRVILVLFDLMVLLALYTRKNLMEGSTRLREIIVPLAIIFFWALFNVACFLPKYFSVILLPKNVTLIFALIGTMLAILGWLICLVAVYQLRHSFSIFVQVRPLVTTGAYAFTRHPIYLGYILVAVGLCLSWPSILSIAMTIIYIWLTAIRARLEEKRLKVFFPRYTEYAKKTPMLFITLSRKS